MFWNHAGRESVSDRRLSPRTGSGAVARHLFDYWPQVARAIRSAKRLALFMDFDGTMVALRRRPSDVKPLGFPWQRVLRRLAEHNGLDVYVISGRRLARLRRLVPVRNVHLLGLHGWEGREVPPLAEERRLIRIARQRLDERLSKTLKVWLDGKGLGLAVHYRGVPLRVVRRARAIVRDVLRTIGPQIHMVRGHKVWELLPRQIDGKGPAVIELLSKKPQPTLPIFVDDDMTDESAFRALRFFAEGFSNDIAQWALAACNRAELAEQLAALDIRDYLSLAELRSDLLRTVAEYCANNPAHARQEASEPFLFCAAIEGVAEILTRLVPILQELGLAIRWDVITGGNDFFEVTKAFHNALHGGPYNMPTESFEVFLAYNEQNIARLQLKGEFTVIYDPQPVALIKARRHHFGHWIWRCHIDLSRPNPTVWQFLEPWVTRYDGSLDCADRGRQTAGTQREWRRPRQTGRRATAFLGR
jgi:trehalose-phosphatase